MLVLARKVGQRVRITRELAERVLNDGAIDIEILPIKGRTVRLGFEAPEHYRISREEADDTPPRKAA